MRKLVIMRGISGSGKSFVAKSLGGIVCSTDDWFMWGNEYRFNPELLMKYHGYCLGKCHYYMNSGTPLIVIDNTNILKQYMTPYLDLAKEHGYEVEIKVVECDVETCVKRNAHNVPEDVIREMAEKFER